MQYKNDDMDQESPRTLTDNQIVTERKISRRSFLAAAGTFMAGATAIVAGTHATTLVASPQGDPDKKKGSDPGKKKGSDPDKKKGGDPDKKKGSDPDKKKGSDPDKKKV